MDITQCNGRDKAFSPVYLLSLYHLPNTYGNCKELLQLQTLTSLDGSLRVGNRFLSSPAFPLGIGFNKRQWKLCWLNSSQLVWIQLPSQENTHIPLPTHPLEIIYFLLLKQSLTLKVECKQRRAAQVPTSGWLIRNSSKLSIMPQIYIMSSKTEWEGDQNTLFGKTS